MAGEGPQDPLELGGGGGGGQVHELVLIDDARHPGHGPYLGVGQLTPAERGGGLGKLLERSRHAHLLPGGTRRDGALPRQPLRSGLALPTLVEAPAVELGHHHQKPIHPRMDVGRQRGQFSFESLSRKFVDLCHGEHTFECIA